MAAMTSHANQEYQYEIYTREPIAQPDRSLFNAMITPNHMHADEWHERLGHWESLSLSSQLSFTPFLYHTILHAFGITRV